MGGDIREYELDGLEALVDGLDAWSGPYRRVDDAALRLPCLEEDGPAWRPVDAYRDLPDAARTALSGAYVPPSGDYAPVAGVRLSRVDGGSVAGDGDGSAVAMQAVVAYDTGAAAGGRFSVGEAGSRYAYHTEEGPEEWAARAVERIRWEMR